MTIQQFKINAIQAANSIPDEPGWTVTRNRVGNFSFNNANGDYCGFVDFKGDRWETMEGLPQSQSMGGNVSTSPDLGMEEKMILVTMHEWLGPKRDRGSDFKPMERIVVFYSRASLQTVLTILSRYQQEYNKKHHSISLEFSFRGVQEIPAVPEELLESLNVERVPEY